LAMMFVTTMCARHENVRVHGAVSDEAEAELVPAPVNKAMQRARRNMTETLSNMQAAETAAAAAKEKAQSAAAEKMKLMENERDQTIKAQEESERLRNLMDEKEKAATKHLEHSGAFEDALAKWNGLSKAVEDMQKIVTVKEEAIAKTLERMKADLEAKKDELDAKIKERDDAEQDMMDKKGVVMAAANVQADKANEAAEAEKKVQNVQQELRNIQASFDKAVSRAAKAESESKEAESVARDKKNEHENGKRSLELLNKLRAAINAYYASVDAIEDQSFDDMKSDPALKTAFENYNLMVNAFTEVHKFNPVIYAKVEPAIAEIDVNAMAALEGKCDPPDEKCGEGFWETLQITKLPFPAS